MSSSLPKAKECSSFWITEEGQLWMEENSLTAISFDQCRLGQLVKKATTLATDLPIQDWDQMRCTHQSHVGTNESSTLSLLRSVFLTASTPRSTSCARPAPGPELAGELQFRTPEPASAQL